MSVSDRRLPPFAWISRESLQLVRDRLPESRQQGARNALLALAEASSERHDGQHRQGDTLRALSALAGVSERRLRDHLRELESVGLLRVETERDQAGRDLATKYVMCDGPGADESSYRADEPDDETSADPSGPTRAREGTKKRKNEEPPLGPIGADYWPIPPTGRRVRDLGRFRNEVATRCGQALPALAGDPRTFAAVEQALTAGARTTSDVERFLAEWWPQLGTSDVADRAAA